MDELIRYYWDGVEHGLVAAKIIAERSSSMNIHGSIYVLLDDFGVRIDRHIDEIKNHVDPSPDPIFPVDGEAEWQAWLVELQQQRWDREIQSWAA